MSSPTQKSLKYLRETGWLPAVVEHWNHHAGIRQDLFGFIDLLAIKTGMILGVQATSWGNIQARINKALELAQLVAWLDSGAMFEVWGWRKHKDRTRQLKRVRLFIKNGEVIIREQ